MTDANTGDLIKNLKLFNAKERFFLIGDALGNKEFKLSEGFIKKIENAEIILTEDQQSNSNILNIKEDAFVAMDYHLEWIYGGLCRTLGLKNDTPHLNEMVNNESKVVKGNQEDIDLLIAYKEERDGKDHFQLILIEAKGVTDWSPSQMKSKAERLKFILDKQTLGKINMEVTFIFMSPKKPNLNKEYVESWPVFMQKAKFIELDLGNREILKVTRCIEKKDSKGKVQPSKDGKYFAIVARK